MRARGQHVPLVEGRVWEGGFTRPLSLILWCKHAIFAPKKGFRRQVIPTIEAIFGRENRLSNLYCERSEPIIANEIDAHILGQGPQNVRPSAKRSDRERSERQRFHLPTMTLLGRRPPLLYICIKRNNVARPEGPSEVAAQRQ